MHSGDFQGSRSTSGGSEEASKDSDGAKNKNFEGAERHYEADQAS